MVRLTVLYRSMACLIGSRVISLLASASVLRIVSSHEDVFEDRLVLTLRHLVRVVALVDLQLLLMRVQTRGEVAVLDDSSIALTNLELLLPHDVRSLAHELLHVRHRCVMVLTDRSELAQSWVQLLLHHDAAQRVAILPQRVALDDALFHVLSHQIIKD